MSAEAPAVDPTALFELSHRLSLAKDAETAAKEQRIAIEEEITKLVGFDLTEGQSTYSAVCPAGKAKLTLKQPTRILIQEDDLPELRKKIGQGRFNKVFKKKFSLVAAALAKLEEEDREAWLAVKAALVSKPGKISVDLKNLEVRG